MTPANDNRDTRQMLEASVKLMSSYTRCPNCGSAQQVQALGGDLYQAPTCCHSLRHPPISKRQDQVVKAASLREGLKLAAALPEPDEIQQSRESWERTVEQIEADRTATTNALGFGRFLKSLTGE